MLNTLEIINACWFISEMLHQFPRPIPEEDVKLFTAQVHDHCRYQNIAVRESVIDEVIEVWLNCNVTCPECLGEGYDVVINHSSYGTPFYEKVPCERCDREGSV